MNLWMSLTFQLPKLMTNEDVTPEPPEPRLKSILHVERS